MVNKLLVSAFLREVKLKMLKRQCSELKILILKNHRFSFIIVRLKLAEQNGPGLI